MNTALAMRLFVLFAGLEDGTPYQALLDAAVEEVRGELLPEADVSDRRLCYYCAALAHLRYVQMLAARSELSHTYAGTLAKQHDETVPCGFAERLVYQYRNAAADLLKDRSFVFTGII
ncbi:MAG: hypothetical protein MJ062_06925 [Oscillospiraceae bacterium]|nr:hypothetical protein [Oscillospiraceae bacterium]